MWTNVQNLDSQNISYSIHYSISTIDTSTANVHIFRSNNISQNSFIAPASGMYTFYIFANPAINSTNPIQGVSVTYNVIFYKNINAHDKWNETVPYLLAIIIISVAIIIFAEVQRERTSYILNLNKKQL